MKMTKLTTLFLTATLTLASGSVLAADAGSSGSNGDANAAAEARLRRMQNRILRQTMLITVISTRAIPTPAGRAQAR